MNDDVEECRKCDLVERLRAMPSSLNDACRTMDEAADKITLLTERVKDLEEKYRGAFQMYVDANEARLDAEANLVRAVEILKPLARTDDGTQFILLPAFEAARAFVAEIRADKRRKSA